VNPVKQAKMTHEVKAEILSPEKEVEELKDPSNESNLREDSQDHHSHDVTQEE